MPEFTFSAKEKVFVKHCSKCKTDFVGTLDQEESEKIFSISFYPDRNRADGFYPTCKACRRKMGWESRGVRGEFDETKMFNAQGGCCALCRVELNLNRKFKGDPKGACLDHDHKTGRARGFLCLQCNVMLGVYEVILERNPQFDAYTISVYLNSEPSSEL